MTFQRNLITFIARFVSLTKVSLQRAPIMLPSEWHAPNTCLLLSGKPPFVFSIEMTRDQASLSFVPPCPWAPERSVTGTQTTDPSVPVAITRGRRVHHCLLITCPFENNCFIIALLALNCKGFWWWAAYYILRIEIIILKKLLALDLSSNLEKCLVEIFVQAAHKISLSFSR